MYMCLHAELIDIIKKQIPTCYLIPQPLFLLHSSAVKAVSQIFQTYAAHVGWTDKQSGKVQSKLNV